MVPVFTLLFTTVTHKHSPSVHVVTHHSFFICSFVGLAGHLFFVVSDIPNLFLASQKCFVG